jgi:hypothetical protein
MNALYSATLTRIATTAFLVATVLLAGCAGTSASGGSTGNVSRCGPQSYANADCYGGPP